MVPGKQAGRGRVADSIQPRRRRRAVGWSARSRRGGGMQLGAQPSPSAASPRAKPHWSSPSAGRHTPPRGRPASRGSRPTITACATTPRSPTRPPPLARRPWWRCVRPSPSGNRSAQVQQLQSGHGPAARPAPSASAHPRRRSCSPACCRNNSSREHTRRPSRFQRRFSLVLRAIAKKLLKDGRPTQLARV